MLSNIQIVTLSALSVLGAIVSATLGWLESGEPFDGRKYASSVLRAIVAGLVSALGFSTVTSVEPWDYIIAFLGGAGVDVIGKRASGAGRSESGE